MGFKPQQARSKLESVNEFTDQMAEGLKEMKAMLMISLEQIWQPYGDPHML
jgi:hypothetical protein